MIIVHRDRITLPFSFVIERMLWFHNYGRLAKSQALRNAWTVALIMLVLLLTAERRALGQTVSFGPKQTIASFYGKEGWVLDAGDLNGYGAMDIVESSYYGTRLEINDRTTHPVFTNSPLLQMGGGYHKIADLNQDGMQDVIILGDDDLAWCEGKGRPRTFIKHPIRLNYWFDQFCIADLDGDGNSDLIGADPDTFSIHWLKNGGGAQPTFTDETITTFTARCGYTGAGDLDSDGDIDIVIAIDDDEHAPGSRTYWLENNGAHPPKFTTHIIHQYLTGEISIVDFNHDGRPDVLVGGNWYENDGAKPPNFIYHEVTGMGRYFESAIGDINGDGWMDYVSYCKDSVTNTQTIYWFENNGQPQTEFIQHPIGQTEFLSSQPHQWVWLSDVILTDVDRDGDLDPVLLHYNRGVIWFPNLRLSPQKVALFEPHGGEYFYLGSEMPVSWRTDVAQAGTSVTLELWSGTKGKVAVLAAHDAAANGVGYHTVRVPGVAQGNDYRVRAVSEKNGTLFAESAGAFTILRASGMDGGSWMGYR